jgi:glycosyltransferase involved in cell wall biosynthesis
MMKPLVSIVIPSHERPDYLAQALRSVQEQTYENLQIIISDNSVEHDCLQVLGSQITGDPRVMYVRQEGGGFMDNWRNGLQHARGEYLNLLMDDDLFHPRKVERMVHYLSTLPTVALVTSYRQLIDGEGRELAPLPGTQRLYETDTVLEGRSFGDFILKNGMNVIGEPTTAMFRLADIPDGFARFCGHDYPVLSDLSTWMHLMHGRHCVYIAEPLSYFRIHGGQDQRRKSTALHAQLEWLQLLLDSHQHGLYCLDDEEFRAQLAAKLPRLVEFLATQRDEIRHGDYDIERMQRLLREGFAALVQ